MSVAYRALSPAPLLAWIDSLIAQEKRMGNPHATQTVMLRLRYNERRLCTLRTQQHVTETLVDRLCSADGSVMSHELYPELS